MNCAGLIKKLPVPVGLQAPRELGYEDIVARALTRGELVDDVRGINASIELIQRMRDGDWPTGPVTEEEDFVDLVWHECEFRENYSFSYALYDAAGGYLGCCYLYPVGRRTPISAELAECDVDASWWVTPDAYDRCYYAKLHAALGRWVVEGFPFDRVHYSNAEVPTG